jgi:hypothetical protein
MAGRKKTRLTQPLLGGHISPPLRRERDQNKHTTEVKRAFFPVSPTITFLCQLSIVKLYYTFPVSSRAGPELKGWPEKGTSDSQGRHG